MNRAKGRIYSWLAAAKPITWGEPVSAAAKPAFRIGDYTGAFAGFAAVSAMLWMGPAWPWGPTAVPPWTFDGAALAAAAFALAFLAATVAIVWMSARFAERIAVPIREIREPAAKFANGTPFEPMTTDNDELRECTA